ncbi:MAG TPA: hydroxysqualene dehydroxylase HpnE [Methylotenera sp.]|nr:hydroxysqualene dehydroxylase HpnE [Methylotenera sp.]
MNKQNTHVAVIGGGCAGLSAAVALIEQGVQVTIFEASSQLGGRARTVAVENNSLMHLLDNGQHILLGAYHETLALLKKVGVKEQDALLRLPLQINMQTSFANSAFMLKSASYLPAPLNLLIGLLFSKGLSFKERLSAIKLMYKLKSTQYQLTKDLPLAQFLLLQDQSETLIAMLWEPLCLAALNTPVEIASTRIFLNVLKDSFSGKKSNSDLLLPRHDLSQIISHPVANYIRAQGSNIKLNRRVRSLTEIPDGFNLETRDGPNFFSHVIVAVSPARVEKLLGALPKLKRVLDQTQAYAFQPIYTIYLQYPQDTQLPHVISGLTGLMGQWVFDRGQLCDQKGLIAVIISAEGMHQKMDQDDLALSVAQELHHAYPALTKPLWHKVIAEKRATFSCTTHLARPTNKTTQPNLFLAGDYTYADYPATIEGAVRSGIKCAKLILNS